MFARLAAFVLSWIGRRPVFVVVPILPGKAHIVFVLFRPVGAMRLCTRVWWLRAEMEALRLRSRWALLAVYGSRMSRAGIARCVADVIETAIAIPTDWYDVDSSVSVKKSPAWIALDILADRYTRASTMAIRYLRGTWETELRAAVVALDDTCTAPGEYERPEGYYEYINRLKRRAGRRSDLIVRADEILGSRRHGPDVGSN
jgi:hypothetical protein